MPFRPPLHVPLTQAGVGKSTVLTAGGHPQNGDPHATVLTVPTQQLPWASHSVPYSSKLCLILRMSPSETVGVFVLFF